MIIAIKQPTDRPASHQQNYATFEMFQIFVGTGFLKQTLQPHHISPNKNQKKIIGTHRMGRTHTFFPRIPNDDDYKI